MNSEMNCSFSIVVATFNSEKSILPFLDSLASEVKSFAGEKPWEIIVVDDRSTDRTFEKLLLASHQRQWLRVLRLAKNRGQQVALSAGLAESRGDFVMVIDDDGQNPLREVGPLFNKARVTNADVVVAVADHQRFSRRLTSRIFWTSIRLSGRDDVPHRQLMMRVIRRRAVNRYLDYPEVTRTVFGILDDIGLQVETLEVVTGEGIQGRKWSRYNFRSRVRVFLDTYLSTAPDPAMFVFYTAIFLLIAASLLVAATLGLWASGVAVNLVRYAVLIPTFLLFLALQQLVLALTFRLQLLTFREARRRPLYTIDSDSWIANQGMSKRRF